VSISIAYISIVLQAEVKKVGILQLLLPRVDYHLLRILNLGIQSEVRALSTVPSRLADRGLYSLLSKVL
jgi:hypothetical protein